jgi:hypothetical protein
MVLLTLVVGCKQNETETSANVESQTQVAEKSTQHADDMTPEQLGELGAQIRKSPDRANELLGDHGLDEKSFEAKIRKVTEDPEASKRYTAAYKKASA